MSIEKVQNKRIKEARLNMRSAYNAYRASISDRDALVVSMYREDYSYDYLAKEFQLTEAKLDAILAKGGIVIE